MKIEAIDLFCGIGGLTCGLQKAGVHVIAGIDNDPGCRYAYERNNKSQFIEADITQFDFSQIKHLYSSDSVKILCGCAPCQPFSALQHARAHGSKYDSQRAMVDYFSIAIEKIRPDLVVLENVPGFMRSTQFNNFLTSLNTYFVDYNVINFGGYGVPQSRRRGLLVASRFKDIKIPAAHRVRSEYISTFDTIAQLPAIRAGETHRELRMHRCCNLSALNLARIKQSKPGGTWQDWDSSLIADCHKKLGGQSYVGVYGRAQWAKPAPTLTGGFARYGRGRFGHPAQHRAFSLLEGALLQTFPRDYDFGEVLSIEKTAQHIGNAVPPAAGYQIGLSIVSHVDNL